MHNIDIHTLLQETQSLQSILSDSNFLQSSKKEIENIYDRLITSLIDHNHLYYIDNKPLITDTEYDWLFDGLKKIENHYPDIIRDDSPSQNIIGQYDIQTNFEKSDHTTPILSLQNTYNSEEIMDWHESITNMLNKKINEIENEEKKNDLTYKIQNISFLIQPKYDWLAIVLTYTNGKLMKAVTRGDGYTGDDVTENVKTIKNLPKTVTDKNTVIVRGEIMMPKSVRKSLNIIRQDNGEEPFSNTRNAAAGSLKLLDTNEVAKRWLVCYIYDVVQWDGQILQEFSQFQWPQQWDTCTIEDIISLINTTSTKENLLKADIDFDGLVIKIANPEIRALLGSTNHHPRRAIAYKFPAQQIATQIESIERQVWRTGILTPVANLTPTELSGVTISRVSLHNRDFIKQKDIQLHDRVRLQRSGEVIPYIVGVITNRRSSTQETIDADTIVCPTCKSHAQRIENEVGTKTKPQISTQFFCPNQSCPGILKEQIKHFVSKNCMNIASIGESLIDMFVDQHLITSLSDLYTLTQPDKIFLLKRFPGIATKKIDTLIEELEKSKQNEFRRFLNALGIPGIGIKLAKEIEKALSTHVASSWVKRSEIEGSHITKLFQTISSPDFLASIYGIGETLTEELDQRSNNPINIQLLKQFEQYGVSPVTQNSQPVTGNSICITGTFPLSRSELEFYITQAWYIFSPTLTKTVNYLFVWDNAGSKKDKIWPNTTIISNREEICTMLDISVPLFESKKEPSLGWEMQSLFG
jgi:DNA ligase (NAD+)